MMGIFEYKITKFILFYVFCCLLYIGFRICELIKEKQFSFSILKDITVKSTYMPILMALEMLA